MQLLPESSGWLVVLAAVVVVAASPLSLAPLVNAAAKKLTKKNASAMTTIKKSTIRDLLLVALMYAQYRSRVVSILFCQWHA
jgi:hypothetical protein